ncbi:DUF692 domain-containing protein [Novosphingobium ginsenosidimutans]|uniref:UPF0276 protein FRF71_02205 n=1 Tax=Novosphingobium ginsenosidimutans TaxID=1176536 RepID=A0A5B8S0K4_9SPHN|nr:DUF692 domain-containing protein [Novosphingobium ginsenosidimutans]QEA15041.1 DUF692 domain-containing protein [Novosphingobium ginsenosidimutans]
MTGTIPPFSGFGLGLRKEHHEAFLTAPQPVDFVEVISENFMACGGRPLATLEAVRERYPVILHGVSMSLGADQEPDRAYLAELKTLARRIDPLWVSDHLCWTGFGGHNSHDLLPVPYTAEALARCIRNLTIAQDALERPLLIENPSSYVRFPDSTLTEWQFLAELSASTGCYLLLDVNNVFVSSVNHGFDPLEFLSGIPTGRVRQIHLAGHSQGPEGMLIDTHDAPVPDPVWQLYASAVDHLGPVATMIERDDQVPPLADLLAELAQARCLAERVPA